jgi:hypothetical protein
MTTSPISAVKSEGFGNGKLTFRKKVTIEENTFEGEERVTDIYYFSGSYSIWESISEYDWRKKVISGPFKIEYHHIINNDKLQDSLGNTNCDNVCYRKFDDIDGMQMPIYTETCSRFKSGETIETDIEGYLIKTTDMEMFFAKSCVITNGEDKRTISWEFGENDFYHNA